MLTFTQYLIESSSSGSNRARNIFDEAAGIAANEAATAGGRGYSGDRIYAIAQQLVHNNRLNPSIMDEIGELIAQDAGGSQ